jgi:Flp pilus assembly protein TadG
MPAVRFGQSSASTSNLGHIVSEFVMLRRFLHDKRGNFAILTAIAAVPLFGVMGMGVDFARVTTARGVLQDRADEAVFAMARQGPTGTDTTLFDHIKAMLAGDTNLTNLSVNGRWTGPNEYTVDITGKMPMTLSSILPASMTSLDVAVTSVGRYRQMQLQYNPPSKTFLDPEAGDFNRVYAYCFDKDQKDNPLTHGRSKSVAIADNFGSTYTDPMPVCGVGETMSFQLYNSRNARTNKKNWDNPLNEHYSYFTDTTFTPAETYDLGGWAILETVLCNNLGECKPKSQGGILPEGKNRTPKRAAESCSPGKYMYYGWEDRPPGRGSSDKDYDDIRIIIECPSFTAVGADVVRLVK